MADHGTNARYQRHIKAKERPCFECSRAHRQVMREYRKRYSELAKWKAEYEFYDTSVPGALYDDYGSSLLYEGKGGKPRPYFKEDQREVARQTSLQQTWTLLGGWGPHEWA